MRPLVLSLFPGIGLLDMAFEEEGFCIVRGPDLLWGGDVRGFHPPAGKFDGVIGGPPCQAFSRLRYVNPLAGQKHGNLIPEFERVVREAQPTWFLMENVPEAPVPQVPGYWAARSVVLNNRWLGEEQNRTRGFSFAVHQTLGPHGYELDVSADLALMESPHWAQAVVGSTSAVGVKLYRGTNGTLTPKREYRDGRPPARSLADCARLQGLPEDFLADAPFTAGGKRQVIANGVPLPMGRAIARAVKRALGIDTTSEVAQ